MATLRPLDGGNIKTSRASLIGGIAVAIGMLVLFTALLTDIGWHWALAVLVATALGGASGMWIWKADL
jgi:hypothetical protein